MKTSNISKIFPRKDSDSKQNNHIFNENENNIDNKYLKIEQKQSQINCSNKEEKYRMHDKIHKNSIFDKNYGQKISLDSQANQSTTSKTQRNINISKDNNKELSFDQYLEELKKKYEKDDIYYVGIDETMDKNYYLYSFCCYCNNLAFAYKDKVSCVNKCFLFDVPTDEFNDKYTMDRFMESFNDFFEFHFECNGEIIYLFMGEQKKPYFICSACDTATLANVGVEL